jgi:DNA-binding GntR family transcriptional regulator
MSENLSQKAYWHIHDKLTTGTLRPGFRLSNRAVAKEIGVSFTPVREAFNRLVSEGLLEYREGLGVFVPTSSRREIEELYDVREMIECAVVARICGEVPKATLGEMRQLHNEMGEIIETVKFTGEVPKNSERHRLLDSAFHLALIRGAGNRQLLDMVADLRRKCAIKAGGRFSAAELVGHVFLAEPVESVQQAHDRTQKDHERLLVLLEGNDPKEASLLMGKHIRAGRRLALASVDQIYMDASPQTGRSDYAGKEERSY